MCAGVVSRVRPKIPPRASGSQCGAPNPVNAGTSTTPPLSGTVPASPAERAGSATSRRVSLSHCMVPPALKIVPSTA